MNKVQSSGAKSRLQLNASVKKDGESQTPAGARKKKTDVQATQQALTRNTESAKKKKVSKNKTTKKKKVASKKLSADKKTAAKKKALVKKALVKKKSTAKKKSVAKKRAVTKKKSVAEKRTVVAKKKSVAGKKVPAGKKAPIGKKTVTSGILPANVEKDSGQSTETINTDITKSIKDVQQKMTQDESMEVVNVKDSDGSEKNAIIDASAAKQDIDSQGISSEQTAESSPENPPADDGSFVYLLDNPDENVLGAQDTSSDKQPEIEESVSAEAESESPATTESKGNSSPGKEQDLSDADDDAFLIIFDDIDAQDAGDDSVVIERSDDGICEVLMSSDIRFEKLNSIKEELYTTQDASSVVIDLQRVNRVDSASFQLLLSYRLKMEELSIPLKFVGLPEKHQKSAELLDIAI